VLWKGPALLTVALRLFRAHNEPIPGCGNLRRRNILAKFRILALDGGGVRGAFTARLLERLDALCPGFLDLALGLAAGLSPRQCRGFFEAYGPSIVPRSFPYDVRWIRTLRRLIRALYGNREVRAALTEQFADRTLATLRPKWVLIASFVLDNASPAPGLPRAWKAKFFHNFPDHPNQKTDAGERLVDVALRTSAAPTFLPVVDGFVDGGVVANNPSMCALAQALNPDTGRQKLDDVVLLSVGTGLNPLHLPVRDASWGIAQWMLSRVNLADLFMDGSVGLAEYQCRQVLGNARFHRLNPVLEQPIELDNSDQIPWLVEAADRVELADWTAARRGEGVARTADWLAQHWLE
jgi:hypothetical protein